MCGTLRWLVRHSTTIHEASRARGESGDLARFIIRMFKLLRGDTVVDVPEQLREAIRFWAREYASCSCGAGAGTHDRLCGKWVT